MVVTHPVLFDTRSLDVVGNGPDFSKQFVQADAERTVKAGLRSPEFLAALRSKQKTREFQLQIALARRVSARSAGGHKRRQM